MRDPDEGPPASSWWELVFWIAVALVILAITQGSVCVMDRAAPHCEPRAETPH